MNPSDYDSEGLVPWEPQNFDHLFDVSLEELEKEFALDEYDVDEILSEPYD